MPGTLAGAKQCGFPSPSTWVCKPVLRFVMGTTRLEFVSISAYLQMHFFLICILIVWTVVCNSGWWCVFMCLRLSWYGQWHTLEVCTHSESFVWLCWWVGVACWMSVWNVCGIKRVLCATYEGGGLSVWEWGKGWSVCVALCVWRLCRPAPSHRTFCLVQ